MNIRRIYSTNKEAFAYNKVEFRLLNSQKSKFYLLFKFFKENVLTLLKKRSILGKYS